jgi:hypothetical protein
LVMSLSESNHVGVLRLVRSSVRAAKFIGLLGGDIVMAEQVTVRTEEVLPVRSRISWGAIFAGAMVALALYFLLTLLGGAIGLSISGRIQADKIGNGAALWAIAVTLVSLFVGGCVASQCTVGETKNEAILYGVVVWGVVFGILLFLTASAFRTGFHALMGVANVGEVATRTSSPEDFEAAAQRAGMSQTEIDTWKQKLTATPEATRNAVTDPNNQRAATEGTAKVAWWAFLGTLLSMIAAVGGAYLGAGPKIYLMRLNLPRVGVYRRGPAVRV